MGQEYDAETGLNYLNARYYNSNIGRFISQDPMFWDGSHTKEQLIDPQSWNSYSYARN
ncbi:MAG: type IV secretion protein Rhs, partial [Candidatus Staskawiczbacteria bacterium]|nr:type IV secretion protein Rhs [Candidatus Staskawiczbacteria bacterium]